LPQVAFLLQELRLYVRLQQCDDDLAAEQRRRGCHRCGGVLHSARYPRKPRGGPVGLGEGYTKRSSFCCAIEGCRRRVTPPSLRFLGRKAYLGAVVVAMSAHRRDRSSRLAAIRRQIGVSRRTLRRWARWWEQSFPTTAFWKTARGRFTPPPPEAARLPASLLERFADPAIVALEAVLSFLAPVTTASAWEVAMSAR
jgi:hypothetical protein